MKLLRLALASLAAVSLSSCGDPPGGADSGTGLDAPIALTIDARAEPDAPPDAWAPDAGPPVTFEQLTEIECRARAEIVCSAPWDCGCRSDGEPSDLATCLATEEERCVTSRRSFPDDPLPVALASGRLRADLARFRECWEGLVASFGRCSALPYDQRVFCSEAFDDDAELGGECSVLLGQACADGAGVCSSRNNVCSPPAGAGRPCGDGCAEGLVCVAGTCTAPSGPGAACVSDEGCTDGLACSGGTCRTLAIAGGPCVESADCAARLSCVGSVCSDAPTGACTEDSACAALEGCFASATRRVCRPLLALDEACESDDACADGRCFRGTYTCAPRLGAGELLCFTDFDCADGLYCSDFGSCQVLARSGEACFPGRYSSGCVPGLACIDEGMGATCVLPPEFGESCPASRDCGDMGRCDSSSMTCRELHREGEPCFVDDCASGLFCRDEPMTSDSYCEALIPVGEACPGWGCADGAYCAREVTAMSCRARVCEALVDL